MAWVILALSGKYSGEIVEVNVLYTLSENTLEISYSGSGSHVVCANDDV